MEKTQIIRTVAAASLGLVVLIQLVPYGHAHTNPVITGHPQWDSPRTEELARRACYDCHSNETKWPWYSHIAPISWLVQDHVDEARSMLNFSEMDKPQEDADEAAEAAGEGEMPPPYYSILHSGGRLTEAERAELSRGLRATLGGEDEENEAEERREHRHGHRRDDDDDD